MFAVRGASLIFLLRDDIFSKNFLAYKSTSRRLTFQTNTKNNCECRKILKINIIPKSSRAIIQNHNAV
jgi:hypothetical protein